MNKVLIFGVAIPTLTLGAMGILTHTHPELIHDYFKDTYLGNNFPTLFKPQKTTCPVVKLDSDSSSKSEE